MLGEHHTFHIILENSKINYPQKITSNSIASFILVSSKQENIHKEFSVQEWSTKLTSCFLFDNTNLHWSKHINYFVSWYVYFSVELCGESNNLLLDESKVGKNNIYILNWLSFNIIKANLIYQLLLQDYIVKTHNQFSQ